MKKQWVFLLAAGALSFAPCAHAMTFDEALAALSGSQPTIDSEVLAARAGIESLKADASLPGPEVEFSYEWGLHGIGTKLNAGVSQSFDWPGVYSARHEAVKEAEQALVDSERSKRRELSATLRSLLVDYIAARRTLAALNEVGSVLDRQEQLIRRGYEGGEISILDVNKITIAQASIHHEIHLATSRVEDLEGSISETSEMDTREILSRLDDAYPVMSIPDEEQYVSDMMAKDSELIANASEVRQAEISARIERRSNFPGFSAGYTYSLEQGETFNGFSIGMTLPSRANVKRAAAARLQAEASAMASIGVVATRRAQYHALVASARQLESEISNLGPVFEKCDNIKLLEKAYSAGQISLLDFLQELEYFSQARLNYLEDIGQYHVTLAKLNRYSF